MTRLLLPTPVLGSKPNTQSGEIEDMPLLARAPEAVRSDGGLLATLLLVDRALRRASLLPQELTALCRRPGTMLTMHSRTKGFGDLARKLFLDGAILPGRVQILEIGDMRLPTRSLFNEEQDCDWHVLTRTLSLGDRRDRGAETDDIALEQEEAERLAAATRSGYPLFVLGPSAEVTPLIRLASQHCLDADGIDAALLTQMIATVCGHDPAAVERELSATAAPDLRFEHLPLDDLSVAIRPGLPLARIIELLGRFARRASATAAAAVAKAEDDREDDDDEADGFGSTRRLDGAGTRAASKAGRTSSSKTSAGSSSERTRSDKDAGSIIIEPDPEPEPGDGSSAAAARLRLTVETMAGIGEARTWALDLKSDLDLWRSGAIVWDALSTRLLLHGPPGTGKTSFARALANTLNLPLHVASVQVWLEPGYLGSVLKRMSAAFAGAEAAAPAILFIDEADAIGRRQPDTREYSDYWNAIVNRMLELMDGAVKSPGVIVLGATNRPEALDAALTRSGRWERQIALPRPDRAALAGIIAHHLGPDLDGLTYSDAAEANAATRAAGQKTGIPPIALAQGPATSRLLQDLARRSAGRSGADIERLVREARGRARREGRALTLADLEAAFDGERPKLSESLRRRMAIHEAGHAVVRHALAIGTVLDLSIEDAGGGYAISRHDLDVEQDETWMMAQMAALLGGRAAEDLILGSVTTGSGGDETSDLAAATRLALSLELETGFGSERPLTHRSSVSGHRLLLTDGPVSRAVERRLDTALGHAKAVLDAHRPRLLRLADALQAAGWLDAREIATLLDGADGGPTDGMPDAADEA